MESVHIAGYDVYVAKNNYVDRRMLDTPSMRSVIEDRLQDVLKNLYFQRAHQTGPLRRFKRVKLQESWRLYFRVHEDRHVAVITALAPKATILGPDNSGLGMDQKFLDSMLEFEDFSWARMEPLGILRREEKARPEEKDIRPPWTVGVESISEEEAMALLVSLRRSTSTPGLFSWVMKKIERGEERILVDPIEEGVANNAGEVKKWRLNLAAFFRERHVPWSVRYDQLSEKLIVIPRDKIDVYCWGVRGRR